MARVAKKRLDQILVERGLAESRTRAQALIMAGKVSTDNRRLDKAGQMLAEDQVLRVKGQEYPWVSRGGVKLVAGLSHFAIDPRGAVAIDVGASTGGFTDVLLTHGAARVYAVDVGHGQLAWKLRSDPRVAVLEKTNARLLGPEAVPKLADLVVCDASFISLKLVLPAALALTRPGAYLIALIKPQFEVGREAVGKKGVVRDPAVHAAICADIQTWLAAEVGWSVIGVTESPLRGPEGNIEFLIAGRRSAAGDGSRL